MDPHEAVYVVQFPHPGRPHGPGPADWMPWNRGPHRRKFLRSAGRAVDASGRVRVGDFVFWGEWEPPSRVIARWPAQGRQPRSLHAPVWEHPATADYRQNTDPWVFGDSFRYSNCKQLTSGRNPSALQSLTPGSVILFGSKLDGAFVLDTVFVVGDAHPFVPTQPPATDEAFRVCTVDSLVTDNCGADRFTLYRGATYEDPIAGMYSFAPCRDATRPDCRFARVVATLPGYINPASGQSPSGARQARTLAQARQQWDRVRAQVLDTGCELGVAFATPPAV